MYNIEELETPLSYTASIKTVSNDLENIEKKFAISYPCTSDTTDIKDNKISFHCDFNTSEVRTDVTITVNKIDGSNSVPLISKTIPITVTKACRIVPSTIFDFAHSITNGALRVSWKATNPTICNGSSTTTVHYYINDNSFDRTIADNYIDVSDRKGTFRFNATVNNIVSANGLTVSNSASLSDIQCCIPKKPAKIKLTGNFLKNAVIYRSPVSFVLNADIDYQCGYPEIEFTINNFPITFVREGSTFRGNFSMNFDSEKSSLATKLKISSYDEDADLAKLYSCFVPELVDEPEIINKFIYARTGLETTITFRKVSHLETKCFDGNGRYQMRSCDSEIDGTCQEYMDISWDKLKLDGSYYTYSFIAPEIPNLYYYQISATNEVGEKVEGPRVGVQVCSTVENAAKPLLGSPNFSELATVSYLAFTWSLTPETMAIKCSSRDQGYVEIELNTEDEYNKNGNKFITTIAKVSLRRNKFIFATKLLSLNTVYKWRAVVFFKSEENTARREEITLPSDVLTFTTVKKHCAYLNCNNSECIQETVSCKCHSGYRGVHCDISGIAPAALVGIVIAVVIVLIVVLAVIFIVLKRRYIVGLRIPDLSRFQFTMPKQIYSKDTDALMSNDSVQATIEAEPNNDYSNVISLIAAVPITEVDTVSCALVYAFERNGGALQLLLHLIDHEIATSRGTETLFRNNSIATKCFKVYARMVGLPYLYRVVYPLVNKLYKEEQKT